MLLKCLAAVQKTAAHTLGKILHFSKPILWSEGSTDVSGGHSASCTGQLCPVSNLEPRNWMWACSGIWSQWKCRHFCFLIIVYQMGPLRISHCCIALQNHAELFEVIPRVCTWDCQFLETCTLEVCASHLWYHIPHFESVSGIHCQPM